MSHGLKPARSGATLGFEPPRGSIGVLRIVLRKKLPD